MPQDIVSTIAADHNAHSVNAGQLVSFALTEKCSLCCGVASVARKRACPPEECCAGGTLAVVYRAP